MWAADCWAGFVVSEEEKWSLGHSDENKIQLGHSVWTGKTTGLKAAMLISEEMCVCVCVYIYDQWNPV